MSKSASEIERKVEILYWLDIEKLAALGHKWVAFGVKEAKNGFGSPKVTMFCGAGVDQDAAAKDAMEKF